MDEISGVALALQGGVPTYQVGDEEGRTYLLIHLPIEEKMKTDGVSGDPIMQALIRDRSLRARWSWNRAEGGSSRPTTKLLV
jgi:hypothetical protein